MPNCFQLIDKETNEPAVFAHIDDRLCEHLGVEPDKKKFLYNWYDTIGLGLAMGKTWDEMRTWWANDSPKQNVINFLEQNYTPDAWRER